MKLKAATAACVVLAAVTGCGSAASDEDQVRAAYRDLGRAIKDGDARRVCELMTLEVRQAINASAARAGVDRSCPEIVRKNLRGGLKTVPWATVKRVTITGDTALATIGVGSIGNDIADDVDTVWMRKVSGDWLIDRDHDSEPRSFQADGTPLPKRP